MRSLPENPSVQMTAVLPGSEHHNINSKSHDLVGVYHESDALHIYDITSNLKSL